MLYYKRLFDAGLLPSVDIVSLHPYQLAAPEEKDGPFNYEERLNAVRALAAKYGAEKPVWSTESNWILGHAGDADVNAPDLDEHTQAEYVVRVNLISMTQGVPYFLHMPFYHSHHPQVHLDTLAAYSNLSNLLHDASNPPTLSESGDVYAATWQTPRGTVTAVWSARGTATVSLSGMRQARFLDFYGNTVTGDPRDLSISTAPAYLLSAPADSPQLKILHAPQPPTWRRLADAQTWFKTSESRSNVLKTGVEMTSQPRTYTYQLRSPAVAVEANTCYIARLELLLEKGSLMLFAAEQTHDRRLGEPVYISYVPDGKFRESRVQFLTGPTKSIQLILANGNLEPEISQFVVENPVQIARCDN